MEDLSEKEQLDALKAWWAENGNYVMGGIFVGIVAIFGWNRWQTNVSDTEIAASTLFEDVMAAAALNLVDNAADAADGLFADYNDTAYAAQARLAMARMYMDSGRDQDAVDVLSELVTDARHGELALVAQLRLGKILLYQDKAEEAVELLSEGTDSAFAARFNHVLGDAYEQLGRYDEAQAAYIAALNDNPQAPTVDTTLIQLKINDLPAPGEATPEEEATATDEDDTAAAEEADVADDVAEEAAEPDADAPPQAVEDSESQ